MMENVVEGVMMMGKVPAAEILGGVATLAMPAAMPAAMFAMPAAMAMPAAIAMPAMPAAIAMPAMLAIAMLAIGLALVTVRLRMCVLALVPVSVRELVKP